MSEKAAPLVAIGFAYVSFGAGLALLALSIGPQYQHTDNLNRGIVFLVWSVLALLALAVSCTILLVSWRKTRMWLRLVTLTLNVPVLAAGAVALVISIWSMQDYAASTAAYDSATQVCGHPPVIAEQGFGSRRYLLPGSSDYDRLRYTTHDRFILGGDEYFCTAGEAQAHGYQPQ